MGEVNPVPEIIYKVWQYFDSNSQEVERVINFVPEQVRVWQGFGAKAAKEIGMSVNYFYKCTNQLATLGCIIQLQHGAFQSPTIYRLVKAPDHDEMVALRSRGLTSDRLQTPTQYMKLQDGLTRALNRIIELEHRVARLERHGR